MEEKLAQRLFYTYIYGDSLYPLKNGKIIIYNFRTDYEIRIFSGKTFQEIFFFDLHEIIEKYKNEKDKSNFYIDDRNNNCRK